MNIVMLTQVLPYPPDSGPKVKTWNVLKYLAHTHAVTLISFVRGDQSADVAQVRRLCRAVHTVPLRRGRARDVWALGRSLVSGHPFVIVRDDRPAMRGLVDRVVRATRPDIVHVDQINMLQYVPARASAAIVLDAHNALWTLFRQLWEKAPPGARKWLLDREWRLLHTYEGAACRRSAATLAVSDADQRALEDAAGGSARISVVPIAVDIEAQAPIARMPDARHIVHMGTMYWPPNQDAVRWFAREVYPLIRAERPDAAFDVIGARPSRTIAALAQPGSGITVTGHVPDPTPFLQRTAAFVVPLLAGSGMRVKILNALAQALPVVSTSIGCAGIALEPGRHLLVADTAESFAQATLRLLNDASLARELGINGRRFVEAHHDHRSLGQRVVTVYEQALRRVSSAPGANVSTAPPFDPTRAGA
jgi:glycosyltransferase involved in cell wall biosynthesis